MGLLSGLMGNSSIVDSNELRKEFEVKVNQDVFNKVKQQLNQ